MLVLWTGPFEQDHGVSLCLSGVMAWEKFVEAGDFVVGDLIRGSSEPGLGIDVVQFCRFDEGEGDGHGFAAAL